MSLVVVERVESLHKLATSHAQNAVQFAIECGRELLRVKAELKHGEFGKWCEGLTFSVDQAQRYMRVARIPANTARVPDLSLRGLLASVKAERDASKTEKKHHCSKKPSKADKARLEEIEEAKARGVSMLTTYARLTVTALRATTNLTSEERETLDELADAIQNVTARS